MYKNRWMDCEELFPVPSLPGWAIIEGCYGKKRLNGLVCFYSLVFSLFAILPILSAISPIASTERVFVLEIAQRLSAIFSSARTARTKVCTIYDKNG